MRYGVAPSPYWYRPAIFSSGIGLMRDAWPAQPNASKRALQIPFAAVRHLTIRRIPSGRTVSQYRRPDQNRYASKKPARTTCCGVLLNPGVS